MQELYTVSAFLFILLLELKKNSIDDKYEKNMQKADGEATIVLAKLEEYNNG